MYVWDFLKTELEQLREMAGVGPLDERTWDCDPLLVIDSSDGSIAFAGRTDVKVTPHSHERADLLAQRDRDGWYPSLLNAKVEAFSNGSLYGGGSRNGLICTGYDKDACGFVWHINGAADYYAAQHPPSFDSSVLGAEDPS